MEKLKNIIKELKEILKSEDLGDVSTDVLVDCSVRIYNSGNINKDKISKTEFATSKQKYTLKQLGISFNEDISKQYAFKLIKEAKDY